VILGFTVIRNKNKRTFICSGCGDRRGSVSGGGGSGGDHHPRNRGRRRHRILGQASVPSQEYQPSLR